MYFEDFDEQIRCTDLETKRTLTDWFAFQRAELAERYESIAGWDGTDEDMVQWHADSAELKRWRDAFVKLGLVNKLGEE